MLGFKIVKKAKIRQLITTTVFAFFIGNEKKVKSIIIKNTDKDNLCLHAGEISKQENAQEITLSRDILDDILNIISANDAIFELESETVEKPPESGETMECFFFSDTRKGVLISSNNIWYFEDSTAIEAPNAYLVLKVFSKIKRILLDNGVGQEWFDTVLDTEN